LFGEDTTEIRELLSPYGRKGFFGALMVLPYAERGYQVLLKSCRGTAGSGGQFLYARHELRGKNLFRQQSVPVRLRV
jgi:predicted acyl esterase